MKLARIKLKSNSPYSQSRYHNLPKLEKELADAWEQRTCVEKGHYLPDGRMFIPPMSITNSIKEAAKYLSLPVPGKGKSTFTKHFDAGILIVDQMPLPVTRETVRINWLHLNADGRVGGNTRVMRGFPTCDAWEGEVDVHILDDIITEEIFKQVVFTAGNLIGIGQFRPRNRGYFGRFSVEVLSFK